MQGRPWKQQQGYRAVPDRGEIIVQAVVPFLIYAIATEILLLSCPFFKGDAAQAANVIAGCLTVAVWGKLRKRREPKKEDRSRLLSRENAVFIGALLAAGIFYCMGGSGLLTLIFFGVSKKAALEKLPSLESLGFTFLCIGILIPVIEEFLFRKTMYRTLREDFGILFSALFSSVVFGMYHGSLSQGLYAGGMGFFLALLYERYQKLSVPVMVHVGANLSALFLGLLPWTILLTKSQILWITAAGLLVFVVLSVWLLAGRERATCINAKNGRDDIDGEKVSQ